MVPSLASAPFGCNRGYRYTPPRGATRTTITTTRPSSTRYTTRQSPTRMRHSSVLPVNFRHAGGRGVCDKFSIAACNAKASRKSLIARSYFSARRS